MPMPIAVEIGTTGDMGILIAGIFVGAGMVVKMVKWWKEIEWARDGTGKKYEPSNGRSSLTPEQHKHLCEASGKATGDALQAIQEEIKESNKQRREDVRLMFTTINGNHEDIKDRLSQQGERIASLETEVRVTRG